MSDKSRADVHQTVTNAIIKMLETADAAGGSFPWCRPGVALSRPINALTNKPYRGINVLTLWACADAVNYRSGIWATFAQWKQLGASVKKGEKASPIVFYKQLEVDNPDAEASPSNSTEDAAPTKLIRMARGYHGFNADQVDGYVLPELPTIDLTQRLTHVECFIAHCGVPVAEGGVNAFYRPADDRIQMPDRALFRDTATSSATEGFYGVLLHELGHASGSARRLNRDLCGRFGSESYAVEELVAELTSAMLCGDLAITPQPRVDHARYIANWLKVLKSDKTAIFAAAAKANQAAEYLHGLQPTPNAVA